ncbi:MFS transporter [Catenuloplanes atrovinosus]|uniref:EmrB/QacA subfamily drug resistance transporter n=1 Tax=Catenuloplanes atrovinosus TaxID=137266 RepID=A0AAE4CE95_9ACTN|nr:MFS transporter [Catenuloplanes atrovinosus]MDR7279839.1 EmrB/QacA subfamily drug resistance transporter [Catenuloplanes atrovinosus]
MKRWWALAALALSLITMGFDVTILNVALPTLATELDATTGELQWMVDAFVLVFAGLLLPMGALGDRYGRKRLLLAGLVVIGLASLAMAWAGSPELVIAGRVLMGVGAALITPISLAVLPTLFGPEERGRAIAVLMAGMGVGIPLGPVLGGYLLEHYWWGSVFLINVPVVLVAVAAIAVLLPESRDAEHPGVDYLGGLLAVAGLVALVWGVIEAPVRGWGAPSVLSALGAGAVLLTAFVLWERRARAPMIDLALFARRRFLGGTIAAVSASFGLFGLLFLVPQYLGFVLGFDPLETGLGLMPVVGGVVLGSPLGERLAARLGHRLPVVLGLLVLGGGLLAGAATGADDRYGYAAAWYTAVGLGCGMALAPAMDAVIGELPPARSGSGTSITMTLRQVAGAFGVALLGSLLSRGYADRVPTAGLPPDAAAAVRESPAGALAVAERLETGGAALATGAREAFLHGTALALTANAAVALAGAIVAGLLLRAARRDTSESRDELARTP